jgi:hypothetical protein
MISKEFKPTFNHNADILALLQETNFNFPTGVDVKHWLERSLLHSLILPQDRGGFGNKGYNAYKEKDILTLNDVGLLLKINACLGMRDCSMNIKEYTYFHEINEVLNDAWHEQYNTLSKDLQRVYATKRKVQEHTQMKVSKKKANA